MNKKLLVSVAVLLLVVAPAWSSGAGTGAGTTSANFLKIGAGARPAAMGDAFTAVADDTNAVYWNPAGMMLTRGMGFTTTHSEWMEGVSHEFFGYSQKIGRVGAIGGSLIYLTTGKFRQTLETPTGEYAGEGDEISATDFAVSGAYAQRLGLWWGGPILQRSLVGIKATFVGQKAVELSGYGFSFDLGYIYEFVRDKVYFGAVLLNVGTKVQDKKQPFIFKVGASYKKKELVYGRDYLLMSVETDGHIDTGAKLNIGSEYKACWGGRQAGALRLGYRIGGDLGSLAGLTTGGGYSYGFGIMDAGVDYAFVPYGIIGNTHRVSISISVGGRLVPPKAFLNSGDEFTLEGDKLKIKLETKAEEEISKWRVTVRDGGGKWVKVFSGEGEPPGELSWDGKSDSGELVKEGDYYLTLEVEDEEEQKVKSEEKMVLAWLKARPEPTPKPTPGKVRYKYAFKFADDLFFNSGNAELKPGAFEALAGALATINEKYPGSYIIVEGHTDNVRLRAGGEFADNQELSSARAEAVRQFFATQGMEAGRLSVMGYGESNPIAGNETAEGRQANRRVELIVYGEKEAGVKDLLEEAAALVKQGDNRVALPRLLKAVELDPAHAKAYRMLGYCYFKLGDKVKAREAFDKSLQLNPKDKKLKRFLEKWE